MTPTFTFLHFVFCSRLKRKIMIKLQSNCIQFDTEGAQTPIWPQSLDRDLEEYGVACQTVRDYWRSIWLQQQGTLNICLLNHRPLSPFVTHHASRLIFLQRSVGYLKAVLVLGLVGLIVGHVPAGLWWRPSGVVSTFPSGGQGWSWGEVLWVVSVALPLLFCHNHPLIVDS